MTPEQSKKLKVGTRVYWNGEPADRGNVTATNARYVTIKWEDGHQSFTGDAGMQRIELAPAKR